MNPGLWGNGAPLNSTTFYPLVGAPAVVSSSPNSQGATTATSISWKSSSLSYTLKAAPLANVFQVRLDRVASPLYAATTIIIDPVTSVWTQIDPPPAPPVTTTTTPPQVSIAHIGSLSVNHGTVGTKVTIRGRGFGTSGSVKVGTDIAVASYWTSTSIVVIVPARSAVTLPTMSAITVPAWYRHAEDFPVTVTPKGGATSNAVNFRLDIVNQRGDQDVDHDHDDARGHNVRHVGERD